MQHLTCHFVTAIWLLPKATCVIDEQKIVKTTVLFYWLSHMHAWSSEQSLYQLKSFSWTCRRFNNRIVFVGGLKRKSEVFVFDATNFLDVFRRSNHCGSTMNHTWMSRTVQTLFRCSSLKRRREKNYASRQYGPLALFHIFFSSGVCIHLVGWRSKFLKQLLLMKRNMFLF